jgi:hypothetical protein
MALSPTVITPVLDPNCLDSSNAASEVYPPLAGTTTTANDVGAGEQILRNQTHTLNEVKADLAGDTFTGLVVFNAGADVPSGQALDLDSAEITGDHTVSGIVHQTDRVIRNRVRVAVSDASQTIDVEDGARFVLTVNPAAPRTITLNHSTVPPFNGETITCFWFPKTTAVGAGTQYTFAREDATVIATFDGSAAIDTGLVWAEFEYVGGTGWKLGTNSGTLYDGAGYYGVVGGAGS